ncbi:Histidine protein kinase DivJ [subsurface metagenome]
MITHIFNSAVHGFDLLNNLLEWSRSQTGRIEYEPQDFSLTDLLRQNILSISDAAYKKNIEVQNELKEQILAYADRRMINTIVRNLISNAIKFTKSGGEISISAKKGDGVLIISVIDSGVGIKEENISKLFRLEESISTPGTNKEQGTGLGLILCKEFIEKNGGKIWVESKYGEGSKFKFTIPAL